MASKRASLVLVAARLCSMKYLYSEQWACSAAGLGEKGLALVVSCRKDRASWAGWLPWGVCSWHRAKIVVPGLWLGYAIYMLKCRIIP
jgi:hypothetical protein